MLKSVIAYMMKKYRHATATSLIAIMSMISCMAWIVAELVMGGTVAPA